MADLSRMAVLTSAVLVASVLTAASARAQWVPRGWRGAAFTASSSSSSSSVADDAAAGDAQASTADVAPKKTRRIAVYKLDASGIDERSNFILTDSVVAEVRKLEKTSVVGMDEIKAMLDLEAQKQLTGCSDVSCVAEIAEALGVDGIIIGSVAVVGDTISFSLKHIDQHTATTLGQATRRIDGVDPANVLAAVGPVVAELFPDTPMKPGTTRGVPPETALRIHPPPLDPWVFWSLAGSSGVAVAAGGALAAWNAVAASTVTEKANASLTGTAVSGADLSTELATVRGSFVGLVVAFSGGAVLASAAGVSALFTDWEGAGE